MLVKNWMSRPVVSVEADDSMETAINRIKDQKIHMLPVTENGTLVGIITDRDLKRASASDATSLEIHELIYLISKIKIRQIMTKDPITVPPDLTIEETAEILLKNNISGAPVVSPTEGMVGVITKADIFRVFMNLSGFGERGGQIAFQMEDRHGAITDILELIRKNGGRIVSVLTSSEGSPEGYRKVYVRLYNLSPEDFWKLKDVLQQKVNLLYMVDHRDNKRDVIGG